MAYDANGNVVITKVPLMVGPVGFKGIGVSLGGPDVGTSGIKVNGKPIYHNYDSPSHGSTYLHGNWGPAPAPAAAPIHIPPTPTPTGGERPSDRPSYAHTQSNQFIHDTYDPPLGYERPDSPGDNPYISNFTPKQFGYMNDPSTLSPDDLEYYKGNVKGLDDRQFSVENTGSFLNKYLLDNNLFREEVNKTPKTKISTINKQQESDDVRREVYDDYLQDTPSDRYNTSRYY